MITFTEESSLCPQQRKQADWQEWLLEDQLGNKCFETGRNDFLKHWLVTAEVLILKRAID